MSRQNYTHSARPPVVTDIFGEDWVITKRVDSGQGFDLIYGFPPDQLSNTSAVHHIVDEALEAFVLNHLSDFPRLDIPITGTRKGKLRRIISSRRFKNLADWEARRAPDEAVFWVDPDYIDLPPLRDVQGNLYCPHEIRYFKPGSHIWAGMAETPSKGRKRRSMGYVLTDQLAAVLFAAADHNLKDLDALALPVSQRCAKMLRNQAIGHFRPNLQDIKTDSALIRQGTARLHKDFVKGAVISDALGRRYRIHSIHETSQGDIILRGAPELARNHSGREVILTHEIASLLDGNRKMGSNQHLATRLGLSLNMLTRLRTELGQSSPAQSKDKWWADRLPDLLAMSPAEFARCYKTSKFTPSAPRQFVRSLLSFASEEGLGTPFIRALASDVSSPDIADKFDQRASKVTQFRQALRWILTARYLIETPEGILLSPQAQAFLQAEAALQNKGLSANDAWWADRYDDLMTLSAEEFAQKHDRRALSVEQMQRDIATVQAYLQGSDENLAYIDDLDTSTTAKILADKYRLHGPGPIYNHRKALRIVRAVKNWSE